MGKLIRIVFIELLLITSAALGADSILDANIICSNPSQNAEFYINTAAGKVWYKPLNAAGSVEVQSPLFSGVDPSEKFVGEIMGEMLYAGLPCYTTVILKNNKGKPELQAQIYSKKNQASMVKLNLSCNVKAN